MRPWYRLQKRISARARFHPSPPLKRFTQRRRWGIGVLKPHPNASVNGAADSTTSRCGSRSWSSVSEEAFSSNTSESNLDCFWWLHMKHSISRRLQPRVRPQIECVHRSHSSPRWAPTTMSEPQSRSEEWGLDVRSSGGAEDGSVPSLI